MEVILLERIEKLGQMGDVVTVKPGYARNYLLPNKKALRASEANRAFFESQRAQLEAENLKRRSEAEAVSARLDGLDVTLIRQAGDSGQLYGSVSGRDIADAVSAAGVTIGRGQVVLDRPIKELGLHAVRIGLHPEVAVTVTVNVARTEDEAQTQRERGQSITEIEEEAEAAERAVAIAEEALAVADDAEVELRAAETMLEEEAVERLTEEIGEETAAAQADDAEPDAGESADEDNRNA